MRRLRRRLLKTAPVRSADAVPRRHRTYRSGSVRNKCSPSTECVGGFPSIAAGCWFRIAVPCRVSTLISLSFRKPEAPAQSIADLLLGLPKQHWNGQEARKEKNADDARL